MSVHKHVKLDQRKLTRARRLLGARTESETLEAALDLLISEEEAERRLVAAHRRLRGRVKIEDVFGGR